MIPAPSGIRSSRNSHQRVVDPDTVSSILEHCRVRVLRRERRRLGEQPEGEGKGEKEGLKGSAA